MYRVSSDDDGGVVGGDPADGDTSLVACTLQQGTGWVRSGLQGPGEHSAAVQPVPSTCLPAHLVRPAQSEYSHIKSTSHTNVTSDLGSLAL